MDALKNMKCHTGILLMFDTYITIWANILKFVESEIFFTWKALDIFLMCKRCGPDILKDFFFLMFIFLFFIILKHLIEWLMLEIDKHMPFKILKMPMCILFFYFYFLKYFLF